MIVYNNPCCWFDLHQTRTSGLNHLDDSYLHCLVFRGHHRISRLVFLSAACLKQLLYNTSERLSCQALFWRSFEKLFCYESLRRLPVKVSCWSVLPYLAATCIILHAFILLVNTIFEKMWLRCDKVLLYRLRKCPETCYTETSLYWRRPTIWRK